MTRKSFFASIAAMVFAPFVLKAKPETKTSNLTVKITADVSDLRKQIAQVQREIDQLSSGIPSTVTLRGDITVKTLMIK